MKKRLVFSSFFTLIFLILVTFLFSLNLLAQSGQQMTVGVESTTIFSLFPGFYTTTNSSFDSIVVSSLFSAINHFHITPYILFNYNNLLLKIMLNYWESDVISLLPASSSPEYLTISTNLIYSANSFDLGIHQVIFFSKNTGQITSGVTFGNATFELEDFYFVIKNIFSILDITTGYSGSYFANPSFRAVGPNSMKNSYLLDPLSYNLYPLFLSVENSMKGSFVGWTFNGVNATNYIDVLFTLKFSGIKLDLDFSLPYSKKASFVGVSFEKYFENGLAKFHLGYSNDSIGSFNLYFQPYIAKDNFYTTGAFILTYYKENASDLSSYFFSFDYSPKLSFLKDLQIILSFDGWFDKEQDSRTSQRTGSGTATDPYIYAFVPANTFSLGFDGRYKLDSLIKGFSIDALLIYFITSNNSYAVKKADGTTWTDYINNLTSNTNNLVMPSYTEKNYMLYNFYGLTTLYRLKAFLGINYQFSNFITGLGFEYINLYGDVINYLYFTNSANEFTGRTNPKTPYGYFDRINIILKGYYTINNNLLFGIQFNLFFYPGFPDAKELGYADFTQTNGTVVSAEDQYKLDVINLPAYQLNFVFQIIF